MIDGGSAAAGRYSKCSPSITAEAPPLFYGQTQTGSGQSRGICRAVFAALHLHRKQNTKEASAIRWPARREVSYRWCKSRGKAARQQGSTSEAGSNKFQVLHFKSFLLKKNGRFVPEAAGVRGLASRLQLGFFVSLAASETSRLGRVGSQQVRE